MRGSFKFCSVGNGGAVRTAELWLAHTFPISRKSGSDNAITSRDARIGCPTLTALGQLAITWRGAPPKKRPREYFTPNPSVYGRLTGAAVWPCADHICARLQTCVEVSTTFLRIAPCPPGNKAPATGATGCMSNERRNPHGFLTSPGVQYGHQACDSFNLIANCGCATCWTTSIAKHRQLAMNVPARLLAGCSRHDACQK